MSPLACTHCNASLSSGQAYCGSCGEPREAAERGPAPPANLPPLVGREQVLETLLGWLAEPPSESGWITLQAEMGVGASRVLQEVAARRAPSPMIEVTATAASADRRYGLARFVVLAVWRYLRAGSEALPLTRLGFANGLQKLGDAPTAYVDHLWDLVCPARATDADIARDAESELRVLEAGVRTLLASLASYEPSTIIVLDHYDLADAPSTKLFEALACRTGGPPLTFVSVGARQTKAAPPCSKTLRLARLEAADARAMLDGLVGGAGLPPGLAEEILARARGLPLYLCEAARRLHGAGRVRRSADGPTIEDKLDAWPDDVESLIASRLAQLDANQRLFLGACAVQGQEFYAHVAEAAWLSRNPADRTARDLLRPLEAGGFVRPIHAGDLAAWTFARSCLRVACYEGLEADVRAAFHRATADALRSDPLGRVSVTSAVLAQHYERGEQLDVAAELLVRVGDAAASMQRSEEALEIYKRIAGLVAAVETPAAKSALFAAHHGTAAVLQSSGDYDGAEPAAKRARALATNEGERAQADRLRASLCRRQGRVEEAETILRTAIEAAEPCGPRAQRALLEGQIELADLLWKESRLAEAMDVCRAARGLLGPDEPALALRLDLIQGDLEHSGGRFVDALRTYARARETAVRLGSAKERASAANDLGKVRQDMGDFKRARRHFEERLEFGRRTGQGREIAGALVNISMLVALEGDFATARKQLEEAGSFWEAQGDVRGVGNVHVQLAFVALEAGDGGAAVVEAERALDVLQAGHEYLRGYASAALGEGLLLVGDLDRARTVLEALAADYDEESHPVVHALALYGQAGVALAQARPDDALGFLARAFDLFVESNLVQEKARARMRQAAAWLLLEKPERAGPLLALARESLEALGVRPDLERLEALEARVAAAASARDREPVDEHGDHFAGETLLVSTLQEDARIVGKAFEDCRIVGPAVLVLIGENELEECSFDVPNGDATTIMWQVSEAQRDRGLVGAISISQCKFRRCRFEHVALGGTQAELDAIRDTILDKDGPAKS